MFSVALLFPSSICQSEKITLKPPPNLNALETTTTESNTSSSSETTSEATFRLVSDQGPFEGSISAAEVFTENVLDSILDDSTDITIFEDMSTLSTTASAEESSGGEVVIEAAGEDEDLWIGSEVVETINYKMSTNARLGQLEIRLNHLSDGRVRLALTMKEEFGIYTENTEAAGQSDTLEFMNDQTILATEQTREKEGPTEALLLPSTFPDYDAAPALSPSPTDSGITDTMDLTKSPSFKPEVVEEETTLPVMVAQVSLIVDKDESTTIGETTSIGEATSIEKATSIGEEATSPVTVAQVSLTVAEKEGTTTEEATFVDEALTIEEGTTLSAIVAQVSFTVEETATSHASPILTTANPLETTQNSSTVGKEDLNTETTTQVTEASITMSNAVDTEEEEKEVLVRGNSRMPRSTENEHQRWDLLPATVFLIESQTACSDLATAVESGLHVNALPLAEITGIGSDEDTIGVTWEDVKRGKCLAILKPLPSPLTDKIPSAVDQKAIAVKVLRQRRNGRILKTIGLARTFGAINLASFTVLSVGVTGKIVLARLQYSQKRTMHSCITDILDIGVAAAAVVTSAAYAASSSSSSSSPSSGFSQTFWSANGPILAVGAGVVAVVGLAYYLTNRTTVHRRAETMAASKLISLQSQEAAMRIVQGYLQTGSS